MLKALFYSSKAFLTRVIKSEGFFEPGTLNSTELGAADLKIAIGSTRKQVWRVDLHIGR